MKNINSKFNVILTVLAIILILLLSVDVKAQSWQWAMSGGGTASDQARKVCIDPTGNIYVAGIFNSGSIQIGTITVNNSGVGFDAYVAKFNPSGVPLWAARIGGSSNEFVSGLTCDAIGRVYINGTYTSPFVSIPPMTYTNIGSGTSQVYVACFDASGVVQWLNGYGGTGNEYAGSMVYSNAISALYFTGTYENNNFVINTTTLTNTSATGKKEAYLIKLNSFGTLQWAIDAGSAGCDDWSYAVGVDATGSPAMLGTFSGTVVAATTTIGTTVLTSYGNQDLWIGKYNTSGTFQWARNLGSSGSGDFVGGIDADASNNFYISGYFQSANCIVGTTTLTPVGGYDAFIAKYNSAGTAQWAQKVAGLGDEYVYDLSVDGNDNPYMIGSFSGTVTTVGTTTLSNYTPGPSTDVFIAKYNSSGSSSGVQRREVQEMKLDIHVRQTQQEIYILPVI
ncbi:MAG: hypothetical protein IPJ32_09175 [Sphingobacteriaceae bacterium]|nr:hypothetical protein [Sphingobacteriaceae bacterium]